MNPFLEMHDPKPWGPGSFEMALPLVRALNIQPGMRVLEVGAGSGQIAAGLAKHWSVNVVTLEPWTDGQEVQQHASAAGVGHQVLCMKVKAQEMPFADETFDAVMSIGSFEMIGEARLQALQEMRRVAKTTALIGIAEPMCQDRQMPVDMVYIDEQNHLGFQQSFRSLEWNRELFLEHGLTVVESRYFPEAREWWLDYKDRKNISQAEQELITLDQNGWISLGMVVGRKE